MSRAIRSVVVVSGDQQPPDLLDALLVDADEYDVIFVESFVNGYSRIRRVAPDLIIVLLQIEDVAACQLLSMLKVDGDVSGIPVVTWVIPREEIEPEDDIEAPGQVSPSRDHAIPMN